MTFLALVLGYLFHYSGSIYPGILLHFTNNAMAVLAYYFQDRSEMAKKIVDDAFKPEIWHFVVFSIVLVTVFGFMIQQYKLHKNHE
jgi:membrane protease YdiL (CAAX protease family)